MSEPSCFIAAGSTCYPATTTPEAPNKLALSHESHYAGDADHGRPHCEEYRTAANSYAPDNFGQALQVLSHAPASERMKYWHHAFSIFDNSARHEMYVTELIASLGHLTIDDANIPDQELRVLFEAAGKPTKGTVWDEIANRLSYHISHLEDITKKDQYLLNFLVRFQQATPTQKVAFIPEILSIYADVHNESRPQGSNPVFQSVLRFMEDSFKNSLNDLYIIATGRPRYYALPQQLHIADLKNPDMLTIRNRAADLYNP